MPGVDGTVNIDLSGIMAGAVGGGKSGLAGGILGGLSDISPTLGKMLPLIAGIAGGMAILVTSSKMLQAVLGTIMKLFGLIVKPLGDILAIGLMPIIFILKPIALFFNTIMRPYLLKAMAAMRAGGEFIAQGKPGEAMGAFILGAQFLMKPFFDMVVRGVTEGLAIFADLMSNIPFIGEIFKGVGDNIRGLGQDIIDFSNDALDRQLGGVLGTLTDYKITPLINALEKTGTPTDALVLSFINMKTELGGLSTYLESDQSFAKILASKFDMLDEKARAIFQDIVNIRDMSNMAARTFAEISVPEMPMVHRTVTMDEMNRLNGRKYEEYVS